MQIRTPAGIGHVKDVSIKKVRTMIRTHSSRIRLTDTSRAILGVFAVAGAITLLAAFPGLVHAVAPFIKAKHKRPRVTVKRNIEALVRDGLLQYSKDPTGEVHLSLTKLGRLEALLTHKTVTHRKKKWDGVWRIVIFDIPNTQGKERNTLRRAVRLFGFHQLQKSVWVYPFNCDDFITLLRENLDINKNVLYLHASYIENDRHLRNEFNL